MTYNVENMIIWHTPLQNQDIQTCHFRSWSFSKCFRDEAEAEEQLGGDE